MSMPKEIQRRYLRISARYSQNMASYDHHDPTLSICSFHSFAVKVIIAVIINMGQFIQGLPSLTTKQPTSKHTPIDLQQFSIISSNQNGTVLHRLSDDTICLLSHRQLQQSSVSSIRQRQLNQWLVQNYNHCCNIVQYQIKARSLLCNTQITLKVLLEYGERSLYQMLMEKDRNNCLNQSSITHHSQTIKFDTPLERMNFIKLMLDVVEEQKEKNKIWITFHTKSLIYFPKEKSFKYLYQLNLDESAFAQTFFPPQAEAGKESDEQACVFSMGMVLLSLFLKEDCSDCYNFQNFTFCESIFEDKVERLKEGMITRGLMGILDDQSGYTPQFDEQISQLILLMTTNRQQRLCFAQVKRRYLYLIRKASISYGASNDHHTRSILQPLTSKRAGRGRTKSRPNPNIGCFSTNEDLHFRTTLTEMDQSQFFKISKSNVKPWAEKKHKDSLALKWKKDITNKMKQQKENILNYKQY